MTKNNLITEEQLLKAIAELEEMTKYQYDDPYGHDYGHDEQPARAKRKIIKARLIKDEVIKALPAKRKRLIRINPEAG